MKKMYKGKVNSPATLLVETIDSSVTSIKVADGTVFPEGPNVAVIGTDGNAETIKYDSINGNILVGCVRGFQGKASVWDKDTIIARNFTEYDLDALQGNILELNNNKVEKINGKTLSTNDFTNKEKNKLANIEAEANKYVHPSSHPASMITETSSKRFVTDSEKEKWNNKIDKSQITDEYIGESQEKVVSQKAVKNLADIFDSIISDIRGDVDKKAGKSEIPTKLSQLNNDKNFKTEAEIQELINNSTKLKKEVVTSLPTTGKEDVIYLLKNKNDTNNYYTEYMWISGKWEIIGDTKVDLSEYLKTANLKSTKLRTNKNSINVFTDRSQSDHQLDIILGDLELRTEQNKKSIKTKLSEMTENSTHRTVTDSEKEKWNKKFDLPAGKENQVLTKTTNGAEFKEISSSRSATFVIANYDSSENSKAGADYVIQENESPCNVINSFIEKLPSYGGKIQLTEGHFIEKNDKSINLNKDNITLSGYGESTNLKRTIENAKIEFIKILNSNIILEDLQSNPKYENAVWFSENTNKCKMINIVGTSSTRVFSISGSNHQLLNCTGTSTNGKAFNIDGSNHSLSNCTGTSTDGVVFNISGSNHQLSNCTGTSTDDGAFSINGSGISLVSCIGENNPKQTVPCFYINGTNNQLSNCIGTSTIAHSFYIGGSNHSLLNCLGITDSTFALAIDGSGISLVGCIGKSKNPNKHSIFFSSNSRLCVGLANRYYNSGLSNKGTNNVLANNIKLEV